LNQYYAIYGHACDVENLVWSSYKILNMCEYNLRDKVREGLARFSLLEAGRLLVHKLMLNIVMDIGDLVLRSLTQNL